MKRWVCLAGAVLMVIGMTACGGKKELKADLATHDAIALWDEKIPYEDASIEGEKPSILPYLAEKNETGACMIICPGGGYEHLALESEGLEPAAELNEKGISAFVLQYRLAPYDYNAMMEDVLRAVRFVRYHAKELGVDPKKIGIMGFSAGGHLSLMALENFDMKTKSDDVIDRESAKPDLGVLCYSVISMQDELTHKKTKSNFMGKDSSDKELVKKFSGEQSVREDMPPVFLWQTEKDKAVPVQSARLFMEACDKASVPCKGIIYPKGTHGLGMAKKIEETAVWFDECVNWMKTYDFVK